MVKSTKELTRWVFGDAHILIERVDDSDGAAPYYRWRLSNARGNWFDLPGDTSKETLEEYAADFDRQWEAAIGQFLND